MPRKTAIDKAIDSLRIRSPQTWVDLLKSINGDERTKNQIRSTWTSKAFLIADKGDEVALLTVDEAIEIEIRRKRLKHLNKELSSLLEEIHRLAHCLREFNTGYSLPTITEPVGVDLRGANLTYAKSNAGTKWPDR